MVHAEVSLRIRQFHETAVGAVNCVKKKARLAGEDVDNRTGSSKARTSTCMGLYSRSVAKPHHKELRITADASCGLSTDRHNSSAHDLAPTSTDDHQRS